MKDKRSKAFCWDSNCFCAWFSEEPGRYDVCAGIIDAARKEQVKLLTSAMTLVEVIKIPGVYVAESEDRIADFFRNPYVVKVTLDWYVAVIARDLQRRYPLDARDAIHLATAVHVKADEFHTYDEELLKLDGKIPGVSLRIREPTFQYQTQLFNP